MAKAAQNKYRPKNKGRQMWVPGEPEHFAAIKAEATRQFMHMGAFVMKAALEKVERDSTAPATVPTRNQKQAARKR